MRCFREIEFANILVACICVLVEESDGHCYISCPGLWHYRQLILMTGDERKGLSSLANG